MRLLRNAGIFVLVALFCGCMPITHMSTAPTVKPGHFDLQAGVNHLSGEESAFSVHFGGRFGIAPRLDVGVLEDALSSNADVKVHIITDQMAKFDLSASVGAGVSVLAVYNYYNVIISKNIAKHTPYFAYRNVYINNDKSDEGDDDKKIESLFINIIQLATKDLHQFFIGHQYQMSDHSAFIIEGMFLPVKEETDLFCINAGFKFSF